MSPSEFQQLKLYLMQLTDLSRDALHIYIGLTVLLVVSLISRRNIGSAIPLLAVFLVAVLGEGLDYLQHAPNAPHWLFAAALHDLINTMFWPTVLTAAGYYRHLFSSR